MYFRFENLINNKLQKSIYIVILIIFVIKINLLKILTF